ncbi:Hsp20/alpha crystallin family protein [Fictibacillus sp. Mic-4]|uniref:Hsp20/alpha crystallin family protein n=1 Tax=Fictibacillus TaxID=1329200 RepID=UPI0003F7151D|nr:Hsp20/alpha crystallin family protein [Fictibacillus gelatini]
MDVDKLKQWLEIAQKFQGMDFWNGIFDKDQSRKMNELANIPGFQGGNNAPVELPRVDIYKSHRELIVVIDLPGLNKSDVQLSLSGDQLMIKGFARTPYQDITSIQSERLKGSFERIIQLPETVNEARTAAKFQNGVLEVRILRAHTSHKQIRID